MTMNDRSKWHQRQRLIRLCRRNALANLAAGGNGGAAYRCYLFLVDKSVTGRIDAVITPLAAQCVRVRSYLALKQMGWRDVRI
jgi:hypothetical protein